MSAAAVDTDHEPQRMLVYDVLVNDGAKLYHQNYVSQSPVERQSRLIIDGRAFVVHDVTHPADGAPGRIRAEGLRPW